MPVKKIIRYRSAKTGRFVRALFAANNPDSTIREVREVEVAG